MVTRTRDSADSDSSGLRFWERTVCHGCGYPRRGQAMRQRCPECGVELDEHTLTWHGKSTARVWVGLLVGGAFVMLTFPSAATVSPVIGGVLMFVVAACVFSVYWANRRGSTLSVTPDGLRAPFCRGPVAVGPVFRWSQVNRVAPATTYRGVVLFTADTKMVIDLPKIFRTDEDVQLFVEIVNDRATAQRTGSAGSDGPVSRD